MRLDITKLSNKYDIRFLTDADIDMIYGLAVGNPLFYRFCPPFVTKESIADDMRALPPNKSHEDKYYIGFFNRTKLVAIMDLIVGFPNPSTAFIGLFMVDKSEQGIAKHLGLRSQWQAHDYLSAMRNFKATKVMQIISAIRECDAKSKGIGNTSVSDGELIRELVFFILH